MSLSVPNSNLSTARRVRRFIGSFLPSRVKRLLVNAPDFVDLTKYTFPSLLQPTVVISAQARGWLDALRNDGIFRVESDALRDVAEYLDRAYFDKLLNGGTHDVKGDALGDRRLFARDCNTDRFRSFGLEMTCEISLLDKKIAPMFRSPDLAGVLYNYYHRQPYYRNQPRIQYTDVKPESRVEDGNDYHVDHFRQVSGMLLISDQTEKDTHMEYLRGSHRRSFLKTGIEMTYDVCRGWVKESPEKIVRLVGEKGTLFVYDTTGVHCRNLIANSRRKILIWTVTTGHHLVPFIDRTSDWPDLKESPSFVRRMFDKLDSYRQD